MYGCGWCVVTTSRCVASGLASSRTVDDVAVVVVFVVVVVHLDHLLI